MLVATIASFKRSIRQAFMVKNMKIYDGDFCHRIMSNY